ncbi:MAG: hypothetical protein ACUVX8_05205 [Candidatus Zipacnadales bacterium]
MTSPLLVLILLALCISALAESTNSRSAVTLYVSKLGDNSDGSSWSHAFTTIQAALNAIPNAQGSHRIIIRPDTYMEANLFPAHPGAADAYNELVGDRDGRFGSGRTGWVVIDSSDPNQQGFKSYDWWGPIRAYSWNWSPQHTEPTFSAIGWDRWIFRNLYVTGGDGGLMFDCTNRVEPFTVVVEDCVSIGRAFGGGVASCLSRPEEPITYRRCHLWALDWWGDTAAAYVRVENPTMPDHPDVIFEDCTMVSPQCALKGNNYGFHTFSRVKLRRCRLIVLNFSQPHGTPTDGIIQSVQEGKLLHVDLEDSTLMGYRVFGVTVEKDTVTDIGYTVTGDVKAYVQFQQPVPAGLHRLPHWPVEVFDSLLPPAPHRQSVFTVKELVCKNMCELSPFLWKKRLCHLECVRPASGGKRKDYSLLLRDVETGDELARFAEGYGLASILIHEGVAYVFASRWEEDGWHDVTLFRSRDWKQWESRVVIEGENEQLFNSSVCQGPDGFVMAYESNDPRWPAFTIKFARSADLLTWTKLPESTFGLNRYTACPCLRYVGGYYYVLYLEHRTPRWCFETYVTRSRDLKHWELSSANPVLWADELDEGINASDPEIIELDGKTWVYYSVGDQRTWMNIKRALYPGTMRRFFESWFATPPVPDWGTVSPQPPSRSSSGRAML